MHYQFGQYSIDLERRELLGPGGPVTLRPKVFKLLSYLIHQRSRVVSKEELFEQIWPGVVVGHDSLNTCVKAARKAVGDDGRTQSVIRTWHKHGYRFVAEVREDDSAEAPIGQGALPAEPAWGRRADAVQVAADAVAVDNDARSQPAIAVLAFSNLSGDPSQEYFSDGITEDIITELSRFHSLSVVARHSSFSYKAKSVVSQQVGRELGVDYVVEGSIRRAGGSVRVTAQLIDAASGHHLWAERYDREMEDIFALQDEVVQSIVATLRQRLEGVSLVQSRQKPTDSLTAYELVLRGRSHYEAMTAEEDKAAQACFEQAIELDPGYALAYAQLARVHMDAFLFAWSPDPEAAIALSLEAARKAVALDETDSFARAALASALLYMRQLARAEKEFEKAVSLNPNDSDTLALMGFMMECLGRPEEALQWIGRALRLNPFAPGWYLWQQGRSFYLGGSYSNAIDSMDAIERPPFEIYGLRAASLAQLGRAQEAKAALSDFHREARAAMALYPVDDPAGWHRYWSNAFPYQRQEHLEHLLAGLRKAGLPL